MTVQDNGRISKNKNRWPRSVHQHDTVSERLRRWTRNPLGSARRGSNPLGVEICELQNTVSANSVRTEVGRFGEDADDDSIDRMSMGKCSHTGSNRGPLGYWPNALTN